MPFFLFPEDFFFPEEAGLEAALGAAFTSDFVSVLGAVFVSALASVFSLDFGVVSSFTHARCFVSESSISDHEVSKTTVAS